MSAGGVEIFGGDDGGAALWLSLDGGAVATSGTSAAGLSGSRSSPPESKVKE
jgi:hypothetical protein